MPKKTVIECDCGCRQVRQQSNNWILVQVDPVSFRSWKWDDKRANRKGIVFLAGEDCAHKLYSQWLAARMHKPQEVKTEELGNEIEGEVQVEEPVG